MAEKRPICDYSGSPEELHSGDTLAGGGSGGIVVMPITITIDGGGSVITAGNGGYSTVPFSGQIIAWSLLTSVSSGAIQIDLWKDIRTNFPNTDADSITASAPPYCGATYTAYSNTLTGWTTTITAGDVMTYIVDSCTSKTRAVLTLWVIPTGAAWDGPKHITVSATEPSSPEENDLWIDIS